MKAELRLTLLKYLALAADLAKGEALELEFIDEKEMKLTRAHIYRLRKEEGYEFLSLVDRGAKLWLVNQKEPQ